METGREHWDAVYGSRGEAEVSWFEARPDESVREILAACPGRACSLVDVGGGASRLPDARAVFHFLTTLGEQAAYVATLRAVLSPEGAVIIATFATGGPKSCSGLPVVQHDGGSLERVLGSDFERLETSFHHHVTPGGGDQRFQYSRFRRR